MVAIPWFAGSPQGKQHLHSVLCVSEIQTLLCYGRPIKVSIFLLRFKQEFKEKT